MTNTDDLIKAVIRWGEDKGLTNPQAQLGHCLEELGELAHEVNRGRYGKDFRDAVGDTMVTLIILSHICGADIRGCLDIAYNEIKDRKGKTINDNFVKEEDLNE